MVYYTSFNGEVVVYFCASELCMIVCVTVSDGLDSPVSNCPSFSGGRGEADCTGLVSEEVNLCVCMCTWIHVLVCESERTHMYSCTTVCMVECLHIDVAGGEYGRTGLGT